MRAKILYRDNAPKLLTAAVLLRSCHECVKPLPQVEVKRIDLYQIKPTGIKTSIFHHCLGAKQVCVQDLVGVLLGTDGGGKPLDMFMLSLVPNRWS